MQLFYTPGIGDDRFYTLSEEESRHCVKVLRLREGAPVHLTDGKGNLYAAHIREARERACLLEVDEVKREYGKRPYYLHIAISPTKNTDRFEWFLEKATEAGIDEITPLICERTERQRLRPDRLTKRITAALKQSLKAYHPLLNEAVPFTEFMRRDLSFVAGDHAGEGNARPAASSSLLKCIAHCGEGPRRYLSQMAAPGGYILALIGPEGDFSPEEVQKAADQGFLPLSLGDSRLRTETAGLALCFEAAFLNR